MALSTLFVLISVWTFIKSAGRSLAWSAASVIFFVSGLLVYEGAVVLPLLLLLIGFSKTGFSSPKLVVRPVLVHLVIMAGYILSWNIFFEWRITRFPVESSLTGMISIGIVLFRRIFHGSSYLVPAVLYVALAVYFASRRFWTLSVLLLAILISYLPFFLVKGFAPRFAYLASVSGAVLLSWMLCNATGPTGKRWLLPLLAGLLLLSYSSEMHERITAWKEAGEVARTITTQVKQVVPDMPEGTTVFIDGVPEMHRDAYVFITGLEPAIQRMYPGGNVHVQKGRSPTPGQSGVIEFQYLDGSIRRVP